MLGMGSFVAGTSAAPDYTTITGGAAYDNATASGTAHLEFSLNGAASDSNAINIDLAAGDATAGVATGTVAGTIADQAGNTLIFSVDGASHTVTIVGATTTIAAVGVADQHSGRRLGHDGHRGCQRIPENHLQHQGRFVRHQRHGRHRRRGDGYGGGEPLAAPPARPATW